MPLMFDFSDCTSIVIPHRIQNVALLISILIDIYEVDPEKNLKYLEYASKFGDMIMNTQSSDGAYRNRKTHSQVSKYLIMSKL